MIKKANKNQIIKEVMLENSFRNEENVYIPVNLSKSYCKFFNITSLIPVFVPKSFKKTNNDSSQSLNNDFNKGYNIDSKPLYIKNLQNKEMFSISDIEDNVIKSNIFKKIYSKNIISSNNQEDFTVNQNIIPNLNDQSETFTYIMITPISLIQEATLIQGTSPQQFYSDMIIKVYAINGNQEIIDDITAMSGNVTSFEFIDSNAGTEFDDLIASALFSEFANSIAVHIDQYNQENFFDNDDIRGVSINYNNSLLKTLYSSSVFSDYDPSSINMTLVHYNTGISFDVFNITDVSSEDLDFFTTRGSTFSYDLLSNQDFNLFIRALEGYIESNNLLDIDLVLNIDFSYNDKIINVEKNINILKNKIAGISRSLELFNFENKVKRGNVVSLSIVRVIDNQDNDFEKKYEINLDFNNQDYSLETIFSNTIKLVFRTNDGVYIQDKREFYFDSGLTPGNSISIDETVSIYDYMGDNLNENLYFSYASNSRIESCFLKFYATNYGLNDFIWVGPFSVSSSRSLLTFSGNSFLEASSTLGNAIEFVTNRSNGEVIRDVMTSTKNFRDRWRINFENIITSPEFQQLDYFNSAEDLNSLEEKINNLIANTIVRVKKLFFCNGYEIHHKTSYLQLSSIINSLAITSTQKWTEFVDFDVCDLFSDNTLFYDNLGIAGDYRDSIVRFIRNQSISTQLNFRYDTELSFLIAQNNTFSNLGTPSHQARLNFISFVTEVCEELESTWSVANVSRLQRNLFSSEFFIDKTSRLAGVFNLFPLDVFYNHLHTINYTHNVDQLPQQRESINYSYEDPTINSNVEFRSNLKLGIAGMSGMSSNTSTDFFFHNTKPIIEIDSNSSEITKELYRSNLSGNLRNVKAIIYPVYVCSKKNTKIQNNVSDGIIKTFSDNKNIYITFNENITSESSLDCLVMFKSNMILVDSKKSHVFNELYYNNLLSTMLESALELEENDITIQHIILRLALRAKVNSKPCLITLNIKPFITQQSRDIINFQEENSVNDFNIKSSLVNRLIYEKLNQN